jgi:hypothetical protein
MRFTRTHAPVRLRADFPLAQIQPLPRIAYSDATLSAVETTADVTGLAESDWADYAAAIAIPNEDPDRSFGGYAVAARKRARERCPIVPAAG